jgi:hypothetical protein
MAFGGMRFGAALLALGLWLASAPTQADEPSERIVEVRGDVELMLMEGRTNELDAIAEDYRASRVRISGGWWRWRSSTSSLPPSPARAAVARRIPQGWPSTTSARRSRRGWSAGRIRLRRASRSPISGSCAPGNCEASAPPKTPARRPGGASARQWREPRRRSPRSKRQSLYAHATTAFPTFPAYAPQYYYYMLERWFGEPGEAAAFAASLLAKPGGDQGKIDYVSVAARAATASAGVDDVMKWSGIDYKALIEAYAARQRTVGLTNRDWNVLLFYSTAVRDKKGANFELEHIAGDWDRGVFRDQALIDWVTGWSKSWL